MSISIRFDRLPELARLFETEVAAIVGKTTHAVEARAKESMQHAGTGRVYKRGGKRGKKSGSRYHRASAPGQPPAIDYGVLANSVQSKVDGTVGEVRVGAKYGAALEYGTAKMHARPFMRPAVEKERPGFIDALKDMERRL